MEKVATKVATGVRVAVGALFLIPHGLMALAHTVLEGVSTGAQWAADKIEAFAISTADRVVAVFNRIVPADWRIV